MNQRNQAIETLKQARDSLAEQLTERILECREEILDDAAGDSFMGEIEQIYEKFGNRLSHLSSLISSLPAVIPGLAEQSTDARPAAPEAKPKMLLSSTPACQLMRASATPAASAARKCPVFPMRVQSEAVLSGNVEMLVMLSADPFSSARTTIHPR